MADWRIDKSLGKIQEDCVRFLIGDSRSGFFISINGGKLSGGKYLERVKGKRIWEEEFSETFPSHEDVWRHLLDTSEDSNKFIQLLVDISDFKGVANPVTKKYTAGNRKKPGKYEHNDSWEWKNSRRMSCPDCFIDEETEDY